jgi:WD40 repeat protein
VWDAASGTYERTLSGHTDWIYSVIFSPDGSQIISGSDDCTLRVWDAGSGQVQHVLRDFNAVDDRVDSFLARFPLLKGSHSLALLRAYC